MEDLSNNERGIALKNNGMCLHDNMWTFEVECGCVRISYDDVQTASDERWMRILYNIFKLINELKDANAEINNPD